MLQLFLTLPRDPGSRPRPVDRRRRLPAYPAVPECEHGGSPRDCRLSDCRYSLLPDGVDPEATVPCALAHCDGPLEWGEIGALLGISDSRAQQLAAMALSRPQLVRWLAQLGRAHDFSEAEVQAALARSVSKSPAVKRARRRDAASLPLLDDQEEP